MLPSALFFNSVSNLSGLAARFRKQLNPSRWPLFFISLILFTGSIILSNSISPDNAKWYADITVNLSILLFMPCSYLYTRTTILSKKIEPGDLGHAIPAVVFFTNYIPMFLMQWNGDISVGQALLTSIADRGEDYSNSFNPGLAYISFRYHIVIIYLLLQIHMVLTRLKNICPPVLKQHFTSFKWIILYVVMQSFFFYYWLSGIHGKKLSDLYWLQVPIIINAIIVVTIFLIRQLNNSLKKNVQEVNMSSFDHEEFISTSGIDRSITCGTIAGHEHPASGIVFQDHQLAQIDQKIETVMAGKRQYLMHGYTIRMLSEESGIQSYVLSAYINRQ